MDGTESEKRPQPKPLIVLLPGLSGIFQSQESKNDIKSFVDKKQNGTAVEIPSTVEKAVKPHPFYALTPYLTTLKQPLPATAAQTNNSNKRKNWNSSVKVNKTVDRTSNKQLAHSSVRKVLKFVPKPKPIVPVQPKSPKFLKPRPSIKQPQLQGKVNSRISGVTNIAEAPVTQCNPKYKNRTTISNKENISNLNKVTKPCTTAVITPKIKIQRLGRLKAVPETPLSNESWKSSCDASFLQTEKEIQDTDDKINALSEGRMLEETLNGIKPLVSTPFKDYRQVPELFNNTMNTENSVCENNETITCFDKVNKWREDNKRDESVIVSLCDKLKVLPLSVNDCRTSSLTIEELLEMKKQIEGEIEMTQQIFNYLQKMKESKFKFLDNLNKLISEKMPVTNENKSIEVNKTEAKERIIEPAQSNSSRHSVISSCTKSPSYKIPKKNSWSRNKVFHKSMPNIHNGVQTPDKNESNKALNIYMQMKEQLEFLKTPVPKCKKMDILNTPTFTSHNLQMQLDKLYNYS